MSPEISIGHRKIGKNHAPFIIAELSGNHNQSLDRALQLVEAAARAGAHAVKVQTFKPESMTLDIHEREFLIQNKSSLWYGRSLFDLYKEAQLPWEWHKVIFDKCKELGILAFSSPFDCAAVDFLEELDVPCFKIASFENIDHKLVKHAAKTGKPLIISTGMATLAEIDETVRVARAAGCRDLVLLKCTSSYPASPEFTNVLTIPHMRELFGCQVGLSDHTMGVGAPIAAVAHGATVVEKHFTLSRDDGGVDSAFSAQPDEMRALVTETERAWLSLGSVSYGPNPEEQNSVKRRRSLYAVKPIRAGEILSEENVRAIRPGLGLAPKYLDVVLGKKAKKDLSLGTPITWDTLI